LIAPDVRRDILIVGVERIDEGIITGRVRTTNVLYVSGGLGPQREFEPARDLQIDEMWLWTGKSWGGLPDGTSIVDQLIGREKAEKYMTAELERAVPPGWTVERIDGRRLSWKVVRNEVPSGEWPIQEYGIQLPASLDVIIFTHGNNDVGPLQLHHVLQNALIIDASALRRFGMTACIERLLTDCRPNEWGYT
jgi:hypothetical protein